jgi:hypothetical protein
MSGRPGRSGRRPKSLQHHWLHGSYRRDRHGPFPPGGVTAGPDPVLDWEPTETDRAHLGPAGRRFLDEAMAAYLFNFSAGHTLLMMASELDHMTACQQDIAARGVILTGRNGQPRVNPTVAIHTRALRAFGWLARHLGV